MYVLGGGRTLPNPSNEVDIYDPASDTWSMGLPFANAGRNFAADTDGTNNIWKAGGYDSDAPPHRPDGNLQLPCESLWVALANTYGNCNCDCNGNGDGYCYRGAEAYTDARPRPTPPPRP